MSRIYHTSVARLVRLTVGVVVVSAAAGCPRKDSPPIAANDNPYRTVSENRVPVPEPPAATPEEALAQFMRARTFEQHYETLTKEAKKRWDEWVAWGKRCADLDRKFNEELDKRFGKDTGPSVPSRVARFPRPIGRGPLLQGEKWYRDIVSSNRRTDGSVELVVGSYAYVAPGATAPPPQTFTAVKEGESWKLNLPPFFDPADRLDLLKRYVLAKEQLLGDITSGKLPGRTQAVKALTNALRRGRAAPGSPEEAIEVYEASLLALDLDAYCQVLDKPTRELLLRSLDFARRNIEGIEDLRIALIERFGPIPGQAREPLSYEASEYYHQGLLEVQVLEMRAKSEVVVEARTRHLSQYGSGTSGRDVLLLIRKEDDVWRIEPDDGVHFTTFENDTNRKALDRAERGARDLRTGKFRTRVEFDKAQQAERIKEGGDFVIPSKKP